MQDLLKAICHGKPWIDNFNRVNYSKTFERYRLVHEENFIKALNETESIEEFSKAFVDAIESSWAKEHFWNRNSEKIDTKTMMVVYLSPMLFASSSELCHAFAKLLQNEWNSRFSDNTYTAADYDTIAAGFTNAIFGLQIQR